MTSLVDISCYHCGVRTRTSYGWMATQPRLVCSGCFRDMPLDCAELARWFVAIDGAVKPLDELTGELAREPVATRRCASAPVRYRMAKLRSWAHSGPEGHCHELQHLGQSRAGHRALGGCSCDSSERTILATL